MLRFIPVLLITLLSVAIGCGSRDTVSEDALQKYEDYKDEYGDCSFEPAILTGFTPDWMETPLGFHLNCGDETFRLHSDATFTGTVSGKRYQEQLDLWTQCPLGTEPPETKGIWIVIPVTFDEVILTPDKFCMSNDLQDDFFTCNDFRHIRYKLDENGTMSELLIDGPLNYYNEDKELIHSEYQYRHCVLEQD